MDCLPALLVVRLLLHAPGAAWAPDATARQESHRPYPLARIEFVGLRQVPRARALAAAGIRTNTTVTARDIEAAAGRLADSGLFASVSHRYRMQGYSLIVTFVVEEASWTTPIVFDNFVGYRDQELTAAISARFAVFRGDVPDQPSTLDRIAAALKDRVIGRHPAASVSYVAVSASGDSPRHYRFRLRLAERTFPICRVSIGGLPGEAGELAHDRARSLVGTEYSREFVAEFAARSIVPIARSGGHYQARVASTTAATSDACTGGVEVAMAIERGAIYTWGAIHWSGARAAGVEDLEQVQRAKTGDPADTDRLQDTVDAVVRWYRDRGYMAVQAGAAASVDEDRSIVTCTVRVEEGERFRFGRLELSGLDSEIAARIRGRWSLRAGDFYDAAYTRRFAAQIREAERAALAGRTGITIRERPDAVATRVDVILEFSKPGGQAGAEPAAGDAPGPGPSATRAVGG